MDIVEIGGYGCRFEPSDEVLINCYLLPKVMGWLLPSNLILEGDLYAAEPWNVFGRVADHYWHDDRHTNGARKSIYAFTKVPRKSANSTRSSRTAGCGTWAGSTGPTEIRQTTGDVVGYSKMLTFESSQSGFGDHWIMHEYCLSGLSLETIGAAINDVVLCKISKGVKKGYNRSRVPRAIADNVRVPADDQTTSCTKKRKTVGAM